MAPGKGRSACDQHVHLSSERAVHGVNISSRQRLSRPLETVLHAATKGSTSAFQALRCRGAPKAKPMAQPESVVAAGEEVMKVLRAGLARLQVSFCPSLHYTYFPCPQQLRCLSQGPAPAPLDFSKLPGIVMIYTAWKVSCGM